MSIVPALRLDARRRIGRSARRPPAAAAARHCGVGVAGGGRRGVRHFLPRGVGIAARVPAQAGRTAGAARAWPGREPHARPASADRTGQAGDTAAGAHPARTRGRDRLSAAEGGARIGAAAARRGQSRPGAGGADGCACPPVPASASKLSFMGSLHALKEYAEGRVDLAGFHVPIAGRPGWDRAPYPARAAGEARPPDTLRRSRPGTDPAAEESGPGQEFPRRRRAGPALHQPAAGFRHAPADRPDARARTDRRLRNRRATATRSSRTWPSRQRSPRAAPTPDSACGRQRPSIGSRSSRW